VKLRRGVLIRWLAIGAVAITYAVLAHLTNASPGSGELGVVLGVGPLAAIALTLLWRAGHRAAAVILGALGAVALLRYWPIFAHHVPWLYLLQQAGAYGLLAAAFGRSLAGNRVPLCSRWASAVHGPLTPPVARYTRAVTVAWTVFFVLMTSALIALFLLAPLPVWSVFANFCATPLVLAMFVGEYLVRGRVLPDMQHASILAGVYAFLGFAPDTAIARRG
jgi:uncharacterized membrane protein